MSENYIVINGKRAELTEKQLKQLGIKLPENKIWRANKGELYYFVSSCGNTCDDNDYYHNYDDFRYDSHNYFKTEEDAEKYACVLETEMLLHQYADEHNEDMPWDGRCRHYFIYFNVDSNVINTDYFTSTKEARTIYFSSREIAQAAIKEIGEKRIKDYLTYEW